MTQESRRVSHCHISMRSGYGGIDPAALQSLGQQNSMYGMGGGASNAQLMQQLYRGAAGGAADPWAQQTNSLLGAGGGSSVWLGSGVPHSLSCASAVQAVSTEDGTAHCAKLDVQGTHQKLSCQACSNQRCQT